MAVVRMVVGSQHHSLIQGTEIIYILHWLCEIIYIAATSFPWYCSTMSGFPHMLLRCIRWLWMSSQIQDGCVAAIAPIQDRGRVMRCRMAATITIDLDRWYEPVGVRCSATWMVLQLGADSFVDAGNEP